MKDRFDLEEEILQTHNFEDQLDLICKGIIEYKLTNDEVVNALVGLRVLITLHTNKIYDTMCQALKLNQ